MRNLVDDAMHAIGRQVDLGTFVRVGIDVVSVAEFKKILDSSGGPQFIDGAFTPDEQAFCNARLARLAVRWAAKEAVAKAIGTGFRGLRPKEIEVTHHADGHPTVAPAAGASWPRQAATWQWAISLSHEGDAAVALAVGIAQEGVAA